MDGGSPCRMSIIRIGNITLSKKVLCRPVDFKKVSCCPVDFKKVPCRMLLRPKKGRVALSILRKCRVACC